MALVTISHGFLSGGGYEHVMKGQNSVFGEEIGEQKKEKCLRFVQCFSHWF